MKRENILYLLRDDLENLPPSMSQIIALCQNGCNVKVVTMRASQYIRPFFEGQPVEFASLTSESAGSKNMVSKVFDLIGYIKLVAKSLKNQDYDLVWIGSADTARYCRDLFKKLTIPTVLNIYELYDKNPEVLKAIRTVAQNASTVVVPEYNRAHILKVWLGLKKTPLILPNKPCFPSVQIQPETQKIVDDLKAMNKKIVLYQGWIGKDRDLTKIAQAMNLLGNKEEFVLALMGKETAPGIVSFLQSQFANTIHIPFVQPPQHLFITELAHMGIATYDDSSLNNIFCAPNKIYEYAEKNVPILGRNIPGLVDTVEKFHAGVCVDMDDPHAIAAGIAKISQDHQSFVDSLKAFVDEYNVQETIAKIIEI